MTSSVILSHKDAFTNAQLLENFETLPKIQIHGFGVRGKHFVLIKKKTPFLSRIWFSFLKFLRIIKTDDNSIKKLKEATLSHLNDDTYKEWAKTKSKVTKQGIANLIAGHQSAQESIKTGSEHINTATSKIEAQQKTIVKLNAQVADLEKQNTELLKATRARQGDQGINPQVVEELKAQIEILKESNAKLEREKEENNTRYQKVLKGKIHYKNLAKKNGKKIDEQTNAINESTKEPADHDPELKEVPREVKPSKKPEKESSGLFTKLKRSLSSGKIKEETKIEQKAPVPELSEISHTGNTNMETVSEHLKSSSSGKIDKESKSPKSPKKTKTIRRSSSKRLSVNFANSINSGDLSPVPENKE